MPCFNHGRFVAESIRAILEQSWRELELIVVDDCSSDDSRQVISELAAKDPRIRPIWHQRNLGASESRNDAIKVSSGSFLGFCDADDVWLPQKLAVQLTSLRSNPGFDVAYCDAQIINSQGQQTGKLFSQSFPVPQPASGFLFGELIRRNFINMQSVLMRRECLDKAARFDEKIKWVEDWWYWVQVARFHRFIYSSEPLANYRVHQNSTNQVQQRGYAANRYKVFQRILRCYSDLPAKVVAELRYKMGVELLTLGKNQGARRVMRQCATRALTRWGGFRIGLKALFRVAIHRGSRT
jgi:glycosyltransferase involved in cell wall biosynthesis